MDIFGLFGKPQKAKHLHLEEALKNPKHIGEDYAVMEKLDGWYMYIDCINGKWDSIRSKTGRILPSMRNYTAAFQAKKGTSLDCRLIFEATIPGMIFKDLNGRFNQKQVALEGVELNAHDVLVAKYPHKIFSARYSNLIAVIDHCELEGLVTAVPILAVSSQKEIWMQYYDEITSKPNGEGLILKRMNGKYTADARNHDLMKIKCELTLDLMVIDVERGEGKYSHTLGRLIVQDKNGIKNAISGMSDAERDEWWAAPESIIGAVVETKAMKALPNGSLREGRFKAVRWDKQETDIDAIADYI
jgi:ATP-dependent DNA ligase